MRSSSAPWHPLLTLVLAITVATVAPLAALAAPGQPPGDNSILAAQDDDDEEEEEEGDDDADDVGDDDADDGGGQIQPPLDPPQESIESAPVEPQPVELAPVEQDDDDDVVESDQPRSEQAIVRLTPDTDPDAFAGRFGVAILRSIPERNVYLVQLDPNRDDGQEVAEMDDDGETEWAELNYTSQAPEGRPRYFFTSGGHSEPMAEDQPPPAALNLDAVGCATGAGVTVAVLDTGIDAAHPAFDGRVLNGYNAIDDSDETADAGNGVDDDGDGLVDEMTGHGTHVAGIIAEVAPEADLLPITVLNSDGIGDAFYVAAGIYYAVDAGAQVLNLSLGSTHDARVVADATAYAADEQVLVISAAGNVNGEEPEYPATYSDALSVAATAPGDVKADFSNYHRRVDLSAPGTDIVSAFPGGVYVAWSGTSMAAPFVSGTAALIHDQRGHATLGEMRAALTDAAAPIEVTDARFEGKLGTGRLDIGASVGCGG